MLLLLLLPFLIFLQSLGDDSQILKVLFFGDTVVSGMHNKEADICPFRYEFLRLVKDKEQNIQVVGTNADPDGTCQNLDESLDVHNNGYQNAGIDELLDYIEADLQYLHKPVDYIFSSLGARDCLLWDEGSDHQILAQSIRRIMGRLLSINKNAKIVHIPIMLPETAGTVAVECMKIVNKKLRYVYDDEKNHARIRIVKFLNKYDSDSFYMLDKNGKQAEINQELDEVPTPVLAPPAVVFTPFPPVAETQADLAPVKNPPVPNGEPETVNPPRRLELAVMFLPKLLLTKEIAKLLINNIDWKFRAQTLYPTPEVTKEPEYYGYDWCKSNYEDEVCFEYYYGYAWCLEKYGEDDCYSYYYGDIDDWGKEDNYKWCLNFYDEEYCDFAYHDGKPDTWDWLSFGYHDCMKNKSADECFDTYYGYAWCLNEYNDTECYQYYYGGDDWVWDEKNSYKWCINFYSADECSTKYLTSSEFDNNSGDVPIALVVSVALFGCLAWLTWNKFNCCRTKQYSRLDPMYEGEEDEVELL